jgi:hypothetical protein
VRRFALPAVITLVAVVLPGAAGASEPRRAPDCHFDGARAYEAFGSIRVFTVEGVLYGCLTDVGRAYRLDTGTMPARAAATRSTVFGVGDWVGFGARDRRGASRVRAANLRTGERQSAAAGGAVTALVVNFDGTLAWIAGTELRAKPTGSAARTLGSDARIDRRFLGLEKDQGCAVTWRVDGVQRSSTIHCTHP